LRGFVRVEKKKNTGIATALRRKGGDKDKKAQKEQAADTIRGRLSENKNGASKSARNGYGVSSNREERHTSNFS